MKVIGIIENNHITGIRYGLVEIPDKEVASVTHFQKGNKKSKKRKLKKNTTKHNSVKSARIKTINTEKETKTAAPKKTKRRYRIHATITLSYNFKSSQKHIDLSKKQFTKAKDLFKKKQRKNKIALQNLAQQITKMEPIMDLIVFDTIEALNSTKQKNR